ncbi:uncharacterized protein MYCGRDRAFT_97558 [Zymoseptoria tritici IPO323]|uniref:Uncharacterized protein n=1 Tax=Zymoseptoria tritici (strain CBS 115943 / IPO323) TaxID=336722 RepID=F9XQL7_ZYMTI|nr:uncharacterized protein MYCGRDRAFT_97558 [Zymoseptoria tritici IPO323]EGP82467.1 hypothetical protein MYCGRDRAFT_97558 [Zymoseptoria tritici IPO323]
MLLADASRAHSKLHITQCDRHGNDSGDDDLSDDGDMKSATVAMSAVEIGSARETRSILRRAYAPKKRLAEERMANGDDEFWMAFSTVAETHSDYLEEQRESGEPSHRRQDL